MYALPTSPDFADGEEIHCERQKVLISDRHRSQERDVLSITKPVSISHTLHTVVGAGLRALQYYLETPTWKCRWPDACYGATLSTVYSSSEFETSES